MTTSRKTIPDLTLDATPSGADLIETSKNPGSRKVTLSTLPVSTPQAAADTAVATAAAFAALRAAIKTPSLAWRDSGHAVKHVCYAENVDCFFTLGGGTIHMDKWDASSQRWISSKDNGDFPLTGATCLCYIPTTGMILVGRGASGITIVDPTTFTSPGTGAADARSSMIYNPVDGFVYAVDSTVDKIKKINAATGNEAASTTLAGDGTQDPPDKNSCLAIDPVTGLVWHQGADSANKVCKLSATQFTTSVGVNSNGAIAVGGKNSYVYIFDNGTPSKIWVYTQAGVLIKSMIAGPINIGDCFVWYDDVSKFIFYTGAGTVGMVDTETDTNYVYPLQFAGLSSAVNFGMALDTVRRAILQGQGNTDGGTFYTTR